MTNESTQSIVLGDVEVTRIVEWRGPFGPARGLVPAAGAEVWKDNEDWLAPDHWAPDGGSAVMALQSWVLRSGGRTVLIDTGAGDGRERPHSPHFHRRQGDFPGRLERAGIRPEDVDIVVNTHLHADHVGWNTRDADGEWVPTFPNAQYLLPAADDFHFGPENAYGNGVQEDDRLVYEDSVAPVHRAGRILLWDGTHRIDEHLTLESAPGHTPGSAVLRLASGETGRSSSETSCTAPYRSSTPRATAASAWIRRGRRRPAVGSSNGPRTRRSWSCRRTSAGPGPPKCAGRERGSGSYGGPPTARGFRRRRRPDRRRRPWPYGRGQSPPCHRRDHRRRFGPRPGQCPRRPGPFAAG